MGSVSTVIVPATGGPVPGTISGPDAGARERGPDRVPEVARVARARDDVPHRQTQSQKTSPEPRQGGRGGTTAPTLTLVALAPVQAPPQSGPSAQFLAQALAQEVAGGADALTQHRDAPALGSEAYRRAGAEPPAYSDRPSVFRATA